MAEKSNRSSNVFVKPLPMKLFAAWEIDRTPPHCIPRLCTLNLTRLVLLKPVGDDISSVTLAVKMQSSGSKRTLRSNDIVLPTSGMIDTELDLTFSLQYPHFLKRGSNNLHIMLQRRKRYKNRAMLGFKTLADGVINMAEVLQRPVDVELELFSCKEKSCVLARVTTCSLSSQPIDHEESDQQKAQGIERVAEAYNFSDEDDFYSSNEEGCDSEPVADDPALHLHGTAMHIHGRESHGHSTCMRKTLNPKLYPHHEDRPDPAERNIKQKFIALLKRFRIPEAEVSDSEQYQEELEQELISQNPGDFEDLMDELDSMSDSGPDVDDISISSTPKPSLRPFFSSGTLTALDKMSIPSLIDENCRKSDDNHESGTDPDNTDTSQAASSPLKSASADDRKFQASEKEKKTWLFSKDKNISSAKEKWSPNIKETSIYEKSSKDSECSPQKAVLEQLATIFPLDDSIPDHIILVNAIDIVGECLASHLLERAKNVINVLSNSDLRASFSCLVNKIQKFCNCNSRSPQAIKIGILGQDIFISSILRLYVEHFSTKPSEWQNYVKFLIVPLGLSCVASHLGTVDSVYANQFLESSWRDLLDHCSESTTTPEIQEAVDRIINYTENVSVCWQVAIAEAMVTYKEKSSDDESSQVFIPFIIDVKIGMMDTGSQAVSIDADEPGSSALTVPGSSPPSSFAEKLPRESITPPSSPSVTTSLLGSNSIANTSVQIYGETMDLQLDYWTIPKTDGAKIKETSKLSLKTTFRTLHVSRVSQSDTSSSSLTLSYVSKEKKQKIMRLGKKKEKEKELDNRFQHVEGIHRLICSCRSPQTPLKVTIDGTELNGVKFFQLTAQWQTHVKYFPIALFSLLERAP